MEGCVAMIDANSSVADIRTEVADLSKQPFWFGMLVALTCLALPLTTSASPTISYIQGNYGW
jgi:hypothetical protein